MMDYDEASDKERKKIFKENVEKALKNTNDWGWDIFELERITHKHPLVHLGMKLFRLWNVPQFLRCSEKSLQAWLILHQSNYHFDNPYHNASHAADVLHATSCLIQTDVLAKTLNREQEVAALLAAVAHDVGHPGRGSAFLINTRHSLANLYNDKSVLENYHATLSFSLSQTNELTNIYRKLSQEEYASLRGSIIDMIMATDMAQHKNIMAEFQTTIAQYPVDLNPDHPDITTAEKKEAVQKINKGRRKTILCMLIKCADVSNPCRPWKICEEWALRIVEEYFRQELEDKKKHKSYINFLRSRKDSLK